jgi:hypothetical protein
MSQPRHGKHNSSILISNAYPRVTSLDLSRSNKYSAKACSKTFEVWLATYHRLPLPAWHMQHHTQLPHSLLPYSSHPLTLPILIRSVIPILHAGPIPRLLAHHHPHAPRHARPLIRKVQTTIRRPSPAPKVMRFKHLIAGNLVVEHMCAFDRLSAVRDRQGSSVTSS